MNKFKSISLALMAALSMSVPAFAQTDAPVENMVSVSEVAFNDEAHTPEVQYIDYFSGITGKMNSLYGGNSRVFTVTSPSLSYAEVINVELNINVSSGSDPCYLRLESPDGSVGQARITGSTRFSTDIFDGEDPEGTWRIYTTGSSGVSTASASLKVYYNE
ncbi:hypothetical protein AN641_05830 [Candidatus Epulonipiscioides gigas]|nr:hypothetical protein AN641_05830 [Epulopiscium sp. SCG-C07WGA-EpuloA2]